MNDERFKKLFSEHMNNELENLEKILNILPSHDFSENFENKMQKLFENVGKFNFSIKNKKYKNTEESSGDLLLYEFSENSENDGSDNKEQDSIQSKRKFLFITLNTFSKKVAFAAALAVMAFGAYFPVKAVCSSIYDHVINKTHNKQDSVPDETSVTEATDPVVTDNVTGKEHFAFGNPVMTQTYSAETETAVYTIKTEIITNNTAAGINTKKNSTTSTAVKKSVRDPSNVLVYVSDSNRCYSVFDAGHSAISDCADIPSDYDSAHEFYKNNGETAMMEGGGKAVIVLPVSAAGNKKKSYFTETGIHITSCSTYSSTGYFGQELSYDVYCIKFDKMEIQEGDKAYIKFSGYGQNYHYGSSPDDYIELCYKHIGNGIFELEKMPTTVKGAERFISKNENVATFGNQICMVYLNHYDDEEYLVENIEGETSDGQTVTVKPENRKIKYSSFDIISSYSFELKEAGEYTVDVARYRKNSDPDMNLVYAICIQKYRFSYDGNTIYKSEVIESYNGDVNLDGCIDIYDAVLINDYLSGKTKLNEFQFALTDVNYDGKTDYKDVTFMLNDSRVKCWKDYNNDGIKDKKDCEAIINSFNASDELVEKLYASEGTDLEEVISDIRSELHRKQKSLQ